MLRLKLRGFIGQPGSLLGIACNPCQSQENLRLTRKILFTDHVCCTPAPRQLLICLKFVPGTVRKCTKEKPERRGSGLNGLPYFDEAIIFAYPAAPPPLNVAVSICTRQCRLRMPSYAVNS